MDVQRGEVAKKNSMCDSNKGLTVAESILEAIKDGQWDYEPEHVSSDRFASTGALPGTEEKLTILARRVRKGLPLWHPSDRRTYDDNEEI